MRGTDLEYGDRVEVMGGKNVGKQGIIIGIMLNKVDTSATMMDDNGKPFNSYSKYIRTLKDDEQSVCDI